MKNPQQWPRFAKNENILPIVCTHIYFHENRNKYFHSLILLRKKRYLTFGDGYIGMYLKNVLTYYISG